VKESNQFIPLPASYLRSLPTPTIKRRIALNLYEILVLFGVLAFTFLVPHLTLGVLFEVTAPSAILMAHVYLVLAFYFMWYWTKTGQTLAMQTWRIQLVSEDGSIMKRSQALMRFAIGSLWLIPAALLLFINIKMNPYASMGGAVSIIFFSITLFLWPLSAILDRKNRQSIPDRWSGTRLVQLPNSIPHPVSGSEE
jgi:uncharacterized RDD family membrane protein YckC